MMKAAMRNPALGSNLLRHGPRHNRGSLTPGKTIGLCASTQESSFYHYQQQSRHGHNADKKLIRGFWSSVGNPMRSTNGRYYSRKIPMIDRQSVVAFHSTVSYSQHNSDAKRHKWSRDELCQRIRNVIDALQKVSTKNNDEDRSNQHDSTIDKDTLNVNHCFDLLEACMEIAKESCDIQMAHQAALLLKAMEMDEDGSIEGADPDNTTISANSSRNIVLTPTTPFYDVVLQSYAVCDGGKEAALSSQSILERMMKHCSNHVFASPSSSAGSSQSTTFPPQPPQPTTKTFNIVINAWAKSREKDAGQRAEAVVNLMQEWNTVCEQHNNSDAPQSPSFQKVWPSEQTLVSVVDAWRKSRQPEAAERASGILRSAIEEAKRNRDFKLHPALFHVVLGSWVHCRRGRIAGQHAEEILAMMEESADYFGNSMRPETQAYALVMEVWMRCEQVEQKGFAAQRAEFLLRSMIDAFRNDQTSSIKPDKRCFTTCISAWSRVRQQSDAPERAEALLNILVELFDETKDNDFRPDVGLFNAVIASWTRATDRTDSMERAKACLETLRRFSEPNLVSFNTILDGMGKRGMGEAAIELLDWLELVGEQDPGMLPDRITYNSALSALARDSTHPEPWKKTLKLLEKMKEMAKESQSRNNLAPDPVSYTIALGSWLGAEYIGIDDALSARDLVSSMSCTPDVPIFTTLMQVCSKVKYMSSADSDRALDIAIDAMKACTSLKYGKPNHVAYASCMKAINRLCRNKAEKQKMLEALFEACAREGHVSKQVVISMKIGLWGDRELPIQEEWSKNVPIKSKPRLNR